MSEPRPETGVLRATEPSLLFGVFLTGAGTVLIGPLIPEMRSIWGVTPEQAAILFPFQFVASAVAALFSSRNLRISVLGGFALLASGLALLSTGSWALAPPAMALLGLGVGLVAPAANLLVALRNPDRRGAALTTINLIWGVGAAACPLAFTGARVGFGPTRVLLLAGLSCAAIGITLAFRLELPAVAVDPAHRGEPGPIARLLPIALMLFLYIGIETTVGGWLVTVAERSDAAHAGPIALLIGSGFYVALLIARALAPALLRRYREVDVLRGSLLISGAGILLLLTAAERPQIAIGALVAGFGFATVFPLCVSLLAAATHDSGARNTGWVFAIGSVGGALFPWLAARVGTAGLDVNGRFLLPVVALVAFAVLHEAQRR